MRKKFIKLFLNLLIIGTITFIALEVMVRIVLPSPTNFVGAHPTLGIAFIPNTQSYFNPRENCPNWGTPVSINSHGLKDIEYTYEKPENTFRILTLGDSYTEAIQFGDEITYPTLLEEQLNSLSNGTQFEVINAGRSGTGVNWQYIYYIREGYKYDADLVLGLFIPNDFYDNHPDLNLNRQPYVIVADDGTLTIDDSFRDTWMYQMRYWTDGLRGSALINRITAAINWRIIQANNRLKNERLQSERVPNALSKIEKEAVMITQNITIALSDAIENNGGQFVFILGSGSIQVNFNQQSTLDEYYETSPLMNTEEIMGTFVQSEGMNYLNLIPLLSQYSVDNEVYVHGCEENNGSGHWSPAGHEVTTQAIVDYLIEEALIPNELVTGE